MQEDWVHHLSWSYSTVELGFYELGLKCFLTFNVRFQALNNVLAFNRTFNWCLVDLLVVRISPLSLIINTNLPFASFRRSTDTNTAIPARLSYRKLPVHAINCFLNNFVTNQRNQQLVQFLLRIFLCHSSH